MMTFPKRKTFDVVCKKYITLLRIRYPYRNGTEKANLFSLISPIDLQTFASRIKPENKITRFRKAL